MEFDALDAARQLAAFPPEPPKPEPKASAWSAAPRGIAAGAMESGAMVVDALADRGRELDQVVREQSGAPVRPRPVIVDKRTGLEPANAMRARARDMRPDPQTAGLAEGLLFDLSRVGTKAIGYGVATRNPVATAAALGGDEGVTTAADLRHRGVDPSTAAKAGAVVGVTTALGAALPVAGSTVGRTAALVAVGGPGSFAAQQATTREVLRAGGYDKIAESYDPLDTTGLVLSTVLPAGFGAWAMRGRRSAVASAAGASLDQMPLPTRQALRFDDVKLDDYARTAAEKHGVPADVLLAIKNAGERSGSKAVSPKGAQGVMQFMPETWTEMGGGDRTDPVVSIDRGAAYLAKLHAQYGDWRAAVAHYNGGASQAKLVLEGKRPSFKETAAYLDRVDAFTGRAAADAVATAPRETLDAAMVHNLTLTRDLEARRLHGVRGLIERHAEDAEMGVTADVLRAGDQVAQFVEAPGKWMDFGVVSAKLAAAAQEAGIDVPAGTPQRLRDSAVHHVRNEHPDLDASDWRMLPWLAENFDRVVKLDQRAGDSGPSLAIAAMDHRTGMAYVAEFQVSNRHGKRLVPKTFFKDHPNTITAWLDDKAPGVRGSPLRGRNATANTSETAPRPSPGADIVSRAREERARHLASGQPLDEWVGRSKPPAPVQNLLIGMSEAGRNTARADAMLRDFSRTAEAHPDMPHADIAADVVEAMRAGKEVTPDAAKAAAPTTSDPAAALIAERAQAVEASQPDLVVGADADGKPITASEAMAQARREAATGTDSTLGVDDADLLRVAANCHLQTGD